MSICEAISVLDKHVPSPSEGLPDGVFEFISRMTPLVNVDLLIKDENGRTLLAWRDDPYCGKGWHVPGGIVRFKETLEQRVQKVAQLEIGVDVITYDSTPVALNQIISNDSKIRGHFISILYRCFLPGSFVPNNNNRSQADAGFLSWHAACPRNLIVYQEIYRQYIA